MMPRLKIVLFSICLILLILPGPSAAKDPLKEMYLSHKLIELLQSDNQHLQFYTMGYVTGVAYSYDYLAVICMDQEDIEQKALAEQVLRYYQENPDQRHRLSSVVIKNALRQAYPCE